MHKMVNGKKVMLTPEEIAEVEARWAQAEAEKAEYEATTKYMDDRRAEMPPVEDLIVALWEQVIEGRPQMATKLQMQRAAIKAKYPAPEKK